MVDRGRASHRRARRGAVRADGREGARGDPFAVHIGWTATGVAAGFEIQQEKGEDHVRVAVLDPGARELTHHFLLPGEVVRYRVRAFNAKAASAWEGAAVGTPTGDGPSVPPMGPCIRLPARAPASSGCNPDITILQSPGGNPVSNVPGATNGCRRRLIATYEGRTRELGTFEVQADVLAVEGHSSEGFPLLHAILGAGRYSGARLATLQFRRGRYVEVDMAVFCGEERNDAESPALGMLAEEHATRGSRPAPTPVLAPRRACLDGHAPSRGGCAHAPRSH